MAMIFLASGPKEQRHIIILKPDKTYFRSKLMISDEQYILAKHQTLGHPRS